MADEDGPKIIIDEDWKAQVEREREQAKQAKDETKTDKGDEPKRQPKPDKVTLETVVSTLGMQAMMALGMFAPKGTQEVQVDLVGAKMLIDMLMVLRDKTKGNLTPEEEGYLAQTLSDLQQGYVVRSQQVQEATLRSAGIDTNAGQ